MNYSLPNIPGHVTGKKATLSINNGETVVSGVISDIILSSRKQEESELTVNFDGGCVSAYVCESTPHELEVEE
ncbi:hypothetical protein [Bifidobacterium olomucense]|uniref:Uncharacterized protein n=1 Tax=Bifidobacterium olomucense TaxID=2675324 RepID=A0A7Y0EXA2_9BIFI|nr:hypothetical protein [Bifidobacterium sp. DSM 109959]NMM98120.1 hypothetical protein [Bifidobacterium sp. DSM 109959]